MINNEEARTKKKKRHLTRQIQRTEKISKNYTYEREIRHEKVSYTVINQYEI